MHHNAAAAGAAAPPPSNLPRLLAEVRGHLDDDIIPFWRERALDREHGGYLTCFDGDGRSLGTPEKYLNTQCRLLWWFSTLARSGRDPVGNLARARHGFEFLRRHFWDEIRGGWIWKARADGSCPDAGKVVYGQSFAIYALAEYAIASGETEPRQLAERTFELLQVHCADTRHGGYLENLEPDWSPSGLGFLAGDRKSLDTHMHLLESFTVLFEMTGCELHRRKLLEVGGLICERMIDRGAGCGRNQFDVAFNPIPAIAIRRTWNAERSGDAPTVPTDTTSYGHNLELAWLLRRAWLVAGESGDSCAPVLGGLVEHALRHGVDWEQGGVFRDGTATGGPLVREKEFWQNAEALVGFLDAFEATREPRAWEAFCAVWNFARERFVAPCGEWRVLLDRGGGVLNGHVGNPWKVSYHTGRGALESVTRLERLAGGER